MTSNDQIKFEAESCRFLAFIVGTPAGKILLEWFTEGIEFDELLILRAITAIGSWRLYLYYMNMSVKMMEEVKS